MSVIKHAHAWNRTASIAALSLLFSYATAVAAAPPSADFDGATYTAQGAILKGIVSSNGASTTVSFEYGLTENLGSTRVAVQSPLAAGASNVAVSSPEIAAGSACDVYYYFRVVAMNSAGTTASGIGGFQMPCIRLPVTPLSGCTASANPTSLPATGGNVQLNTNCTAPSSGVNYSWSRNGVSFSTVPNPISALPANVAATPVTTAYQATACHALFPQVCTVIAPISVTVAGASVPAPSAPTVTTNAAGFIAAAGATLNGTVSSNGASATVTFQYGFGTSYGNTVTAAQSPLAAGAANAPISASITGLACNTLYHFRSVGANSAGTTNGVDASFTTAACAPASSVDLNQHGLTGSWYESATSGQGLALEVFPNQSSGQGEGFVSWFTFDPIIGGAERQRWYTLQGPMISGQPSASLTIYRNTGGNFNAPPATTAQVVGTATLSFDSCNTGQLSYTFTDGTGRTGTIPLTRLLPNVTCATTTPYPTNADFALSGAWYEGPTTSGQGFTAEVAPAVKAFFLSWFTYMPNGAGAGTAGQRWYTAQGAFTPGLRTIPVQIYETTGGSFDAPTPLGQREVQVGTGTMAFQSCAAATFSFNFTGGSSSGSSGTIALGRVGAIPPGCVH